MNKIRSLFAFISLLFISTFTFGQQLAISGMVKDSLTNNPIELCNVYLSGTTKGTVTNENGGFKIENLSPGNYTLVVSHLNYEFLIRDVLLLNESADIGSLALLPDSTEVAEVAVEGKKDRIWNRQFNQFKKMMMGSIYESKQIEFINPHVAEFTRMPKGGMTNDGPFTLEIINHYTGYKIFYDVQQLYMGKKFPPFITGYSQFHELEPADEDERLRWEANREEAYGGSLRHFLKNFLNDNLDEAGYEAFITNGSPLDESDYFDKLNTFKKKITLEGVPFRFEVTDTSYPYIKKISFKDFISFEYTKEATDSGQWQKSWIKAKNDAFFVFSNGVLLNPTTVTLYGYLTREGIYQLLPFDYGSDK